MKYMFFVGAKDGQTPEQWEDEYLHAHADQLRNNDKVSRLVLNVLRDPTPEMVDAGWGWGAADDTGILGVDEIWLEDVDDPMALYVNDKVILAAEVETNFVFSCIEPETEPGEKSPWIKRLGLLRKAEGMREQDFVGYWKYIHGPKATRIHRGASRYDQNHFTKILYQDPKVGSWNGSMSLYYFSINAFRYAHFSYPGAQQDIADDCANFQDKFLALPYGEEYVMKR